MKYSWWENVIQIVVLKNKKTNARNKKRLDTARTETSKNRLMNKSINQHNKTNHFLPIRPLIKLRTGLKIKLEHLILRGTRADVLIFTRRAAVILHICQPILMKSVDHSYKIRLFSRKK